MICCRNLYFAGLQWQLLPYSAKASSPKRQSAKAPIQLNAVSATSRVSFFGYPYFVIDCDGDCMDVCVYWLQTNGQTRRADSVTIGSCATKPKDTGSIPASAASMMNE